MVTINKMRSLLISLIFVFEYVYCEIDYNRLNESDTCEECLLGCHQKIGLIVETPTCLGIKSNAQLQVYDGIPEEPLTKLSECLLLNECLKKRYNDVKNYRKESNNNVVTPKPYQRNICYSGAIIYYFCKKRRQFIKRKSADLEDVEEGLKSQPLADGVMDLADFLIQSFGKYVTKVMTYFDNHADVLKQIKLKPHKKKK